VRLEQSVFPGGGVGAVGQIPGRAVLEGLFVVLDAEFLILLQSKVLHLSDFMVVPQVQVLQSFL